MTASCPRCSASMQPLAIESIAGDRRETLHASEARPRLAIDRRETLHASEARPRLTIDQCTACNGVFVDQSTVQQIVDGHVSAEAVLAALPRAELRMTVAPGQKMYLPCPTCHELMNRKLFAAGLVIDVCRPHGTFFDVGELPAMIDFVLSGGLARAPQEPRDALHERARREQGRARDEASRARSVMGPIDSLDAAAALLAMLSDLFF